MAKQVRNPNRFDHLRGRARWGTCDVCGLDYPEVYLADQDGTVTCIDDWEPGGSSRERDLDRAAARERAAALSAKYATPPRYAKPTGFENLPQVTACSPDPLELVIDGASGVIVLTGNNLNPGDAISYSDPNLVNASPPVYVDAGTVELDIQASVGTAHGYHRIVYEGVHLKDCIKVYVS